VSRGTAAPPKRADILLDSMHALDHVRESQINFSDIGPQLSQDL